jgi:hypothetical protein
MSLDLTPSGFHGNSSGSLRCAFVTRNSDWSSINVRRTSGGRDVRFGSLRGASYLRPSVGSGLSSEAETGRRLPPRVQAMIGQ